MERQNIKESQEYWNELQLDGPVTDSQAGDDLSYPRLSKAASFSDLFQLGVSQEIPRNPLGRQNSLIPPLFPGLSSGNFLKSNKQKEDLEEVKTEEKKDAHENQDFIVPETMEKSQKRKIEQVPSPKIQIKKVKREAKLEIEPENILDESALGLTKVAVLQQHLRLDSVNEVIPEEIIESLQAVENTIQEVIQEESNNRVIVNQLFSKQTKAILENSGISKIFDEIIETEEQFIAKVAVSLRRLDEILIKIVLNYHTLRTIRSLTLNLQIQLQQISTLLDELKQRVKFGNCNSCPKCWKLSIIEQPLPNVLFKNKLMESSTTVAVITGTQKVESLTNCEVRCTSEAVQFQNTVQSDPQKLNKLNRAVFSHIKLTESTRMAVIYLKFDSTISESSGTTKLVSQVSSPIVVISHESQWIDAACKLLILECFSNSEYISWFKFANILHCHFVSATRQDQSSPKRPLQQYELQYFFTKYFNTQKKIKDLIVSKDQAENFFQWFGSVSSLIRFKKHIYQFWTLGYIFRFTSKEKCEKILENERPGAFVIRFSESQKGLFGVTYVSPDPLGANTNNKTNNNKNNNNKNNNNNNNIIIVDDNTKYVIKHYLLKQDDTGPNKSLPDFLRSTATLKTLLLCNSLNGTITKMDKDEAMKLYYTIRKTVSQKEGYVEDINS